MSDDVCGREALRARIAELENAIVRHRNVQLREVDPWGDVHTSHDLELWAVLHEDDRP